MSIATEITRDNITVSQKALKNNAEKALEKAKGLHEKRGKKSETPKTRGKQYFQQPKKEKIK